MLIVLLVIILLSQYSALPEQQYLPMIQINQYRWPITGFSVMGAFRDKMPIFYAEDSNNPPMWFQDWWLGCEMYSENGTNYGKGLYHASYVPMVYNEWDSFLLRCNDGRQVLVGNEPELISQSNLTPTEMAILLHTVIGQWNGPVYCCGVMVQHTAYMAQVVAEYRRMFGQWPSTVGVHAHLYIVGLDGSPIVTSVNDADIARAQASLDEFIALLEVNNLLHQRIVISECCVLSNILNQDDVVRASYSLINYAMENSSYDYTTEREGWRVEGDGSTTKLSFFGANAVVKPVALTANLTDITHTAASSPDYALQDLVQNTGFGFATKDEGNTLLAVVQNTKTRVAELETKLVALGLLTAAA